MKIQFTVFNIIQEHIEFDCHDLKDGDELDSFIISKDEHGDIFIVPMIKNKKGYRRPLEVLEQVIHKH